MDTVPVEGRLVVWQISVHIPSLPDNEVSLDYHTDKYGNFLRQEINQRIYLMLVAGNFGWLKSNVSDPYRYLMTF